MLEQAWRLLEAHGLQLELVPPATGTDPSARREAMAPCDLVVLPCWREGLSRSLIEAAAMERPIITTDLPGCRDVIDHGHCGLLVPVKHADALRLAIALLLEQPQLARQFGLAARRKVMREFAVSLVNEHTVATYRRLLPLASAT